VHVPAPPVSLTVPVELAPSPHVTVQVWVSPVPGSLKDADALTGADTWKLAPADGEVTLTVGGRFATATERLPFWNAPVESLTLTETL
jgi:hypothetical protein